MRVRGAAKKKRRPAGHLDLRSPGTEEKGVPLPADCRTGGASPKLRTLKRAMSARADGEKKEARVLAGSPPFVL